MPRANRCFLSSILWHVTHRCYKKEFLLKLARDHRRRLLAVRGKKNVKATRVLTGKTAIMPPQWTSMTSSPLVWATIDLNIIPSDSMASLWLSRNPGPAETPQKYRSVSTDGPTRSRKVVQNSGAYRLKEPAIAYSTQFDPKIVTLSDESVIISE